jgi:protein ImuB
MLWLYLDFPYLPLDVFWPARQAAGPCAIAQRRGARPTIFACNDEARALGVRTGMPASAAHGLAAGLRVRLRDEAAERQALEALAAWAGQFTSWVSLEPPQALLLEVAGSLSLFEGLERLLRRVRAQVAALGYDVETGVAPTPLGARLLARARIARPAPDLPGLRGLVQDLPLDRLPLDDKVLASLSGMGLRLIGEVLGLPRAGLARRLGPAFVADIDRLLGRRADPRQAYRPPPLFERRLDLAAETADREALRFPARRLLTELCGFLAAREAGTQALDWTLHHHRQAPTRLAMNLSAPSRDPAHLLDLLRQRLERLALDHAVEAVALRVTDIRPLPPAGPRLDGERRPPGEDWPLLVERLRARLGDEAVQGLQCRADHRPERAWAACPPGGGGPAPAYPPRPLWLLPEPRPISRDGAPWLEERLRLIAGPERIESGWWDGADTRRDYFVACDGAHARYWIFRERDGARRWFLHGLFA